MIHVNDTPKLLVIGLDGAPYTLITDYIEMGYLPNFKKILSGGFRLHQMDASIPDVSSTSWTSFMTGVNPGEHGIYGFMDLRPGSHKIYFPSSRDIQAPTIWDIIGGTVNNKSSSLYEKYKTSINNCLRSIVLNIPQTYPAAPMNGVLTAGFVCPDMKKGTYPDNAYNYLESIGYVPDVDAAKAAEEPDLFLKEVFSALEKRALAYDYFFDNEPWDLFIGVITETDRLHHFYFDAARNQGHKYHDLFVSFYKRIDEIIGRLFTRFMEKTGGRGLFMTMSDHGFTVLRQEVYVNSLLRERGFLKIDKEKEYFEQIDTGTKAFCMDPARIYVNLDGRFPGGPVSQSRKKDVINELKDLFISLEDSDGNPVIKSICDNGEIYHGPSSDKGPDLVCLANDGYDLKGSMKKEHVFGKGQFSGMHTRYDAHCILPGSIETAGRLHIENLAGIILNYFSRENTWNT